MKLNCEILKIDKDMFKDNCFIIKLGSKDRPATNEDMDDFQNGLKEMFKLLGLEEDPAVLITHHAVSFETISRGQVADLVDSFLRR